jgi:hypothetical protein
MFLPTTSPSALYIATHPEQTVFRLDPAGNRTTLAGPKQGAVGTTACAFGRAHRRANFRLIESEIFDVISTEPAYRGRNESDSGLARRFAPPFRSTLVER